MDETPLDRAHAAMAAGGDTDDAARLRFYHEVADTELFLLLEREADGTDIAPRIFDLDGGRFVMAFDSEDRLAIFAEAPVPYAALPGRIIAGALAGQKIGLGLNLGVATSAFLMPPEALAWLAETLGAMPEETAARINGLFPPGDLPGGLVGALTARLARLPGLAARAWLGGVTYADGRRGCILGFEAAAPGSEAALAKAVSETLVFSGIEAGELDVAFIAPDDPALARLRQVALPIAMPDAARPPSLPLRVAPGMDPSKPPKLR